jgi:hypothetical protein
VNPTLKITGVATFAEEVSSTSEIRMMLNETGTFERDGKMHEVYQQYTYSFTDSSFSILKKDGVLLHHFPDIVANNLSVPQVLQHSHWCSPDTYECTINLISSDMFEIFYRVNGPSKAYTMQTIFRKVGAAGIQLYSLY